MNNYNNSRRSKNRSGKVVLTSLIAGMIGGGVVIGGNNLYQDWSGNGDQPIIAPKSSTGTTSAAKGSVKVQNSSNESNQATKAFNSVEGAVVSVVNLQKQSAQDSTGGLGGILGGQGGSDSSSANSAKDTLEAASEGSGVIYEKHDGTAYVVTNNHVVADSNALEVIMSDGTKVSGKIVGTDPTTDLAVIKINAAKVTQVASFGNSDQIDVGQSVLAIGSPLGSQYATSVTEGIISAKKRSVPAVNEQGQQTGNATVIQTDAAINPGNSGGPLINLAGQVIGINSMKLASDANGTSVEGMGFSIPSNEVVRIINLLVKDGSVQRPALGVTLVDLSNIDAASQKSVLKLPTSVKDGVVIMQTLKTSPAKNAGIKKYDVITELDGKKTPDQATLRDILYSHKVGDTISVKYYRGDKLKTGEIKLTADTKTLDKETTKK
ncbi:PDZ domain-containing protein [Periweissella cryptocerci]|uniref:PDZ domain-containing protein n=1 Tax=Periweissella cryptocerci TaxID=2506420 RepID=A0A4P6YU01_9LACO|nr:trypsin-like peptidase domain-containing protein [Periweissella cryptocerci]QBO36190.1 PDZ domain-containing protein [Periweissella cryptocerci]